MYQVRSQATYQGENIKSEFQTLLLKLLPFLNIETKNNVEEKNGLPCLTVKAHRQNHLTMKSALGCVQ